MTRPMSPCRCCLERLSWGNCRQFLQDRLTANVAAVDDVVTAAQECSGLGPEQAVGVRDDANAKHQPRWLRAVKAAYGTSSILRLCGAPLMATRRDARPGSGGLPGRSGSPEPRLDIPIRHRDQGVQ